MQSISPRVETILQKRGIVGPDAVRAFLSPNFETDTHDASLFADMGRAVDRILGAAAAGEEIGVYADFDCDGIPGAVVLHDLFRLLGCVEHVHVYIPHRDTEGYGFHTQAVDALRAQGVTLIITVDVGVASPDTVAYAMSHGVDVIVTDHHAFTELPPAYAVIHPHRAPYPFPHLCGAAVAFKLAQAVIAEGKRRGLASCMAIVPGAERWMLDMVGIATLSDMVPLVGENRCLASFGMVVLRKSRRPGVRALCRVARVMQGSITEDDVGFAFGPRINAASRMGHPMTAFTLFTTTSEAEATACAQELDALNAQRKTSTAVITKALKKRIDALTELPPVIVMGSSEWKPALLGSVATSIVGTYDRPVCLWGRESTGLLKGSARTNGSVSVLDLLRGAGEVLLQSGGHVGAGGFVVDEARVHLLESALATSYGIHADESAAPKQVDHEMLQVSDIGYMLARELDMLRPFGEGNPKPIWGIIGEIDRVGVFGKEKNHVEMYVKNMEGHTVRAYAFFAGLDSFDTPLTPGSSVTILGSVERSQFAKGRIELRVTQVSA
jgi:single-stranded-DNA-specific exonuclease